MHGVPYVAVIGPSDATDRELAHADAVGRHLASAWCRGRVRGARRGHGGGGARRRDGGGTVVGILPGTERADANPHLTVVLATGMGEMRNALVVRAADVVVAVGGAYGTLSEIAFALRTGVPVVGIGTWTIDGVVDAPDADTAVDLAWELAT